MMASKLRITTLLTVVAALGLVAGPALAQSSPEVLDNGDFSYAGFCDDEDESSSLVLSPLAVTAFGFADAADVDPVADQFLCTEVTYAVQVIDAKPIVRDEVIEVDRPEAVGPTAVVGAQVLGVQLARTGIDAVIVALIGVGLLALGFVALRRTKVTSDQQ